MVLVGSAPLAQALCWGHHIPVKRKKKKENGGHHKQTHVFDIHCGFHDKKKSSKMVCVCTAHSDSRCILYWWSLMRQFSSYPEVAAKLANQKAFSKKSS